MSAFTERMIRAAKLDVALYEEVEADAGALGQAMGVVVLSGLAAGIGGAAERGVAVILFGAAGALAGWFVWAYVTWLVGTKLLPEPQTRSDPRELLRTIGFSSSPGLIRVLGIVPFLVGPVFLVSAVWMLVAMVIAVRQALDYTSTWRALAVCGIGWLLQAAVLAILLAILRKTG